VLRHPKEYLLKDTQTVSDLIREFDLKNIMNMLSKLLAKPVMITLLLIIANFIFKGVFLSSNSIAGDEPFSIFHAQMDVSTIIDVISKGNNPPLYELILHFWIKLFGVSEFSTRLPSLIFSSITVGFIYKIGRNHFNKSVGIIAGLLFILSNYQVLLAHESRVYALVGMLTAISMFHFFEFITKSKNRNRSLIVVIFSNIFLIYSHYMSFFILIVQLIYVLSKSDLRTKFKKEILTAVGVIFIFYLPNINVLIWRFKDSSSNGTWIKAPSGVEDLYFMIWKFTNAPITAVVAIVILLAAGIKYFVTRRNTVNRPSQIVLLWFLLPFLTMFIISFWVPMFLDRYLMITTIGFYILLAQVASSLIPRFKFILPSILVILFAVTSRPNVSNNRDSKGAISKVLELKRDGDLVLICPMRFDINFMYYYDQNKFKACHNDHTKEVMYAYLNAQNIFPIHKISQIDSTQFSLAKRVIYLDVAADYDFPKNGIKSYLDDNFDLVDNHHFPKVSFIYEYESR
jgi:mannosyltransferase